MRAACVALGGLLLLAARGDATAGGGPSQTGGSKTEIRVVTPEERRDFYRTGGKEALDRPIHLHVEAEVLRRAPVAFLDRSGNRWLRFENRSVPLAIPAKAPSWLQARRHLDGAREFCLHGTVRLIRGDERERAGIEVTRIVRAPGSWR